MNDLIQSITIQFDDNPLRASLKLINCVLIAMELENRPIEYKYCYYRTGFEVTTLKMYI